MNNETVGEFKTSNIAFYDWLKGNAGNRKAATQLVGLQSGGKIKDPTKVADIFLGKMTAQEIESKFNTFTDTDRSKSVQDRADAYVDLMRTTASDDAIATYVTGITIDSNKLTDADNNGKKDIEQGALKRDAFGLTKQVEKAILKKLNFDVIANAQPPKLNTPILPPATELKPSATNADDNEYKYTSGQQFINDAAGNDVLVIDPSIMDKAKFNDQRGKSWTIARLQGSSTDFKIQFDPAGTNTLIIKNLTDGKNGLGSGAIEKVNIGGQEITIEQFTNDQTKL